MKPMHAFMMFIAITLFSGCSSLRKATAPDDENLISGAGSIMKKKPIDGQTSTTDGFEEIDLDKLLTLYGLDTPVNVAPEQGKSEKIEEYKYRRNDLQDRLISASNQRCAAYIRTIVSSKSQTTMGWTGLATLLSGAASVVPHAQTAKILAAGSTVSTGLLSTYNEAYFNNLALNVVATGISKQREGVLARITLSQAKSLSQYTVNAAIADALAYHGACNILSGIEAAAKATNGANKEDFTTLAK